MVGHADAYSTGGALLLKLLLGLALLISAAGSSAAQDPANVPTLRIEASDAHSAVIVGLAVSNDGSLIATGSSDRTVRIWSSPGLQPIRKIFLPTGQGNQGAIYTVAFSPDNRSVAATGWTGSWNGEDGPWCFYAIGVEDGQIQRTICDLPHRANHAVYSPDGKFLAFALKSGHGLRVYRTSDYTLVAEDRDCKEASTWVEFDASGRLVTTCFDGNVRLFDKNFRLIASRPMPEGRKPDSLSFSPDGTQIVVGYFEPQAQDPRWPPAIDILSSADLSVLFRPDLRGVDNGALWRVAWSADGNFIYATGTWQRGNRYPIRRWGDGGRGRPRDIQGAASQNMRLRSLPAGGFVFLGEVPYIGVVGSDDRLVAERQIAMADYNDIGEKLGVSRDGNSVQFAFEPSGRELAHFSLLRRTLAIGAAPASDEMSYPVTEMPGLDVRDWSRGFRPTLNGEPLEMVTKYEHALALTFAPDGKQFVLGTVWNVICYDFSGKRLWYTKVPFNTRGVVITPDRRFVVAALGDGTIRWYAMDTGKELMAFFPHRDTKRWVAWTPSGYYMASIDGDALIGWTVNRGRDKAADFFEAWQFRDMLYRPDIVTRTLAARDEAGAVRQANAGKPPDKQLPVGDDVKFVLARSRPPVVRIVGTQTRTLAGADEIAVEYGLRSPSGIPVRGFIVQIDGVRVPRFAGKRPRAADREKEIFGTIKVKVRKGGDYTLSIIAEADVATPDRFSQPASVDMRRPGVATGGVALATAPSNPTLYALIIGVGNYSMAGLSLANGFPAHDADAFAAQIKQQQGLAFSKVEIYKNVLKDREATDRAIRAGLSWLARVSQDESDIALVYFSGHGKADYLLPFNYNGEEIATAVLKGEIIKALTRTNGKTVLILDACQAAGGLGLDIAGLVNEAKSAQNGIISIVSSLGYQASLGDASSNSYFTKAVIEGLQGKAAKPERSEVLTGDLDPYVKQRVSEMSGGKQTSGVYTPITAKPVRLSVIKR